MEELRSMCGICPQHNILYDDLTTEEHLKIFAGIKGVPVSDVEKEVRVKIVCFAVVCSMPFLFTGIAVRI
jgi:ABC-type multidrug transport system ATPase subunit